MTAAFQGIGDLDTPTLLRRGLLVLSTLGVAGLTLELVFLRHWSSATQLIVWPAIAAAGVGLAILARRPSSRRVMVVRAIAITVAVVGIIGVGIHVAENLTAGPLDRNYAATWDSLSPLAQWFLAITGFVGPAPTLAPGSVTEVALALGLATVRHPALADTRRTELRIVAKDVAA